MNRKVVTGLFLVVLSVLLCGCSAKLTTVRPAEISEMQVERLTDKFIVTLPTGSESADEMEQLILQLEEPYNREEACEEESDHEHLYRVSLYIGDKMDTQVLLNGDGSVCKDGSRYIASEKADVPVNIMDWILLFPEPVQKEEVSPVIKKPVPQNSWEPMDVVTSQGKPRNMPAGTEILDSLPVCEAKPWSYYISRVLYDGQEFVMVWRDTPKGDEAQWICSVTQTSGATALRHQIDYAEGSFEKSGGKYMYFTITNGANFHRSLWCFDVETLYFSSLLEEPCSNLLLLAEEPGDAKNIGWIVYDRYLAAVDLEAGATDEGLSVDLSEYIEDEIFYGIGAFGTHKFAQLSDIGGYGVQLDINTAEPETSAPEQRTVYQIDLLTHKFAKIQK